MARPSSPFSLARQPLVEFLGVVCLGPDDVPFLRQFRVTYLGAGLLKLLYEVALAFYRRQFVLGAVKDPRGQVTHLFHVRTDEGTDRNHRCPSVRIRLS